MRHRSIFKKTDVTRATRAVLDAGLEVWRVEINSGDGKITVVPGRPDGGAAEQNPWDEVHDAENKKRAS